MKLLYMHKRCFLLMVRHCTTTSNFNKVRVRFAPSPTGHLHLGGLRTALYNYMFAKANGGQFLLRIEDTDQSRLVPGSAEQLEHVLEWAGLVPDESPLKGGQFGPYRQSDRLHLYKEQVDRLLASGKAYRCFCSEKRLDLLRKEAARMRMPNKYDRSCLHLDPGEIDARLQRGDAYTVRFLLSPFQESWNDLVYGSITSDVNEVEGDPIIMKSDGFPTYHFASVVDDHLMSISHVLRGVEWQLSTPKHLLLYQALGWSPPQFGHLPLIINEDGTKLSKRQGDIHINHLEYKGFYSEAIINFVTLVGGGFPEKQYSLEKCYSLTELCSKFQLNRVNTAPARLEMNRLRMLNKVVLRRRLIDPSTKPTLVKQCCELVKNILASRCLKSALLEDLETVEKYLMWAVLNDRIHVLSDIASEDLLFLWTVPDHSESIKSDMSVIKKSFDVIKKPTSELDKSIVNAIKLVAKSEKVKTASLLADIRTILTGKRDGPPILEIFEILGQKTICKRFEYYISSTSS